MPTIVSHAVVPLALGVGLGRRVVSGRLLLVGVAASMLPDLDVGAFRLGIPYGAGLGHRGATHSVLFAVFAAAAAVLASRALRATSTRAFLFVLVATASHGVLDAFTNGGLGVAFLWPWSDERYFAPVRPIEVSPLSIAHFLSARGARVLASELVWLWVPGGLAAAFWLAARKIVALRAGPGRRGSARSRRDGA